MNQHILLVRPGALGDAILTLPAVEALFHAGAERVTILGTPASWAFRNPALSTLNVWDFGSSKWAGLFSGDLAASAREKLRTVETAVLYLTGEPGPVAKTLLAAELPHVICSAPPRADIPPAPGEPVHAADRLLAPLLQMGVSPGTGTPLLDLSKSERLVHNSRALALHPGSGGKAKCWPPERYAALTARALDAGWTVRILAGPAEAESETLARLRAALPECIRNDSRLEWIVDQPLRHVLALLHASAGYAGNDSGVTHLAARVCPVVALFGPTDPAVWAPRGAKVTVLRAASRRLEDVDVDSVWRALNACAVSN